MPTLTTHSWKVWFWSKGEHRQTGTCRDAFILIVAPTAQDAAYMAQVQHDAAWGRDDFTLRRVDWFGGDEPA